MAKKKSVATKILAYLQAKERGKAAYQEADGLLDQLATELAPGQAVDLGGGRTAALVDLFAAKRVQWKPCGFRQFDVKVSES